ncbi:hypothetical protein [Methylomonas albis]|uniref:Uncharacterized protein n=1 Tax=Methylomonas albis TaxID=1854563 RepID=A0ABR9D8L0_9GAMM|nr:hypothetical protein [Methylomonas albis]MBD9358613.1 hypothetical protein [Methylomonas albis]
MSWKVCEHEDAPINKNAIKILKSDGSWLFHSNINGSTTISMKTHTEPGSDLKNDLYALFVNSFAGNRLIEDCDRLKKRVDQ